MKLQRMFGAAIVVAALTVSAGCSSTDQTDDPTPSMNTKRYVTVVGVVQDSDGFPMAGCSISSTNRAEENAIVSDESGTFTIDVSPGQQEFSVICPDAQSTPFPQGVAHVDVPDEGLDDLVIAVD